MDYLGHNGTVMLEPCMVQQAGGIFTYVKHNDEWIELCIDKRGVFLGEEFKTHLQAACDISWGAEITRTIRKYLKLYGYLK